MLTGLEARRKALHISMGGFAFLLRFLTWPQAALCALTALVFNLLVLPRISGKKLSRPEDVGRGYPIGVLLYPVTVLALILVFRENLALAAAGWAFLAFGDGMATVVSLTMGGPKLPWNPEKSWSGLLGFVTFGGAAAVLLFWWTRQGTFPARGVVLAVLASALIAAVVESLPSELDDNLLPPFVGVGALACLLSALQMSGPIGPEARHQAMTGLAINAAIPVAAYFLKLVRPSGVWSGFVVGTVIYASGGPRAYAILWLFFAAGTLATRAGKRRKEEIGKAEELGGRRGAANVFANVSVAAFLFFCSGLGGSSASPLFLLAATAALATALMDTIGTEIGQAISSPTFLLPDLRPVPPGTDGAVSIVGTLAGLLAASCMGGLAAWLWEWPPEAITVIVIAAFAGTVAESLLGRDGAPWRISNGHVLNFINTLVGAVSAGLILPALFGGNL